MIVKLKTRNDKYKLLKTFSFTYSTIFGGFFYNSDSFVKGTLSRQAHARVWEKHFEIVDPTFSNIVGEFGKLFSSD